MRPVVIVGAGVSGLASAALLARDGYPLTIHEKGARIGGRTASVSYRGHTLDNGFHIMPFYKKSALYRVLRMTGLLGRVELAGVTEISFHSGSGFHGYPSGIPGILRLSLVPFRSRLVLLKLLLPMAFATLRQTEGMDGRPLSAVTAGLDPRTRAFFEAVCMLAFADVPDRVSLGEFARTIIRANPFRGGTSRFAYPAGGGYDSICGSLASYVAGRGGSIRLSSAIRRIHVRDGRVCGVSDAAGDYTEADCVVVSAPAYQAASMLEPGVLDQETLARIKALNETTAVVEVHYATRRRIDTRQIVFPVGDRYTSKGIFFTSNISSALCPAGEHQMISGTPVDARTAGSARASREVARMMRRDIESIYPGFSDQVIWERPMAWKLVESVVKKPGMVWRSKMPHALPYIKGLFFVGDSSVSYGIGTDSAAHSSLLCHPLILEHWSRSRDGIAGRLRPRLK